MGVPLPLISKHRGGGSGKTGGLFSITYRLFDHPHTTTPKLSPKYRKRIRSRWVAEKRRPPFEKAKLKISKTPVLALAAGQGQPCEPSGFRACCFLPFFGVPEKSGRQGEHGERSAERWRERERQKAALLRWILEDRTASRRESSSRAG